MTDQRLRRLEREVATSPSLESEAALLRERLRAGTLSPERLELAAYCGHRPARSLLPRCGDHGHDDDSDGGCRLVPDGQPHPAPIHEPGGLCVYRDLSEFVAGLSRWGPTVQVRAAVAAARVAWGEAVAAEQRRPSAAGLLSMAAINAVEQWLKDPNEGNRIDAARAFLAARPVDAGLQFRWLPMVPTRYQAGTHPTPEGGGWGEEPPYPGPNLWHPGEIMAAAELAGEAPVRAAIQSALITWALGEEVGP